MNKQKRDGMIEIDPKDLRIDTYGHNIGGMNVGMSVSVRITHLPSGIVTECNSDRSQHRNRNIALDELKEKLKDWKPVVPVEPHPDDLAVDKFAAMMKDKLKKSREKGRGGWDDPSRCSVEYLADLLIEHVQKGDPVDVANLAMMLALRNAKHGLLSAAFDEAAMFKAEED